MLMHWHLHGLTRQRTISHVYSSVNPVPPSILDKHKAVSLYIDIMYINKIPFPLTISCNLRIGHVSWLCNQQIPTIHHELTAIITCYKRHRFNISLILGNNKFDTLQPLLPTYAFNLCGRNEHIPEIEPFAKTIKNSVQSQSNDLPF